MVVVATRRASWRRSSASTPTTSRRRSRASTRTPRRARTPTSAAARGRGRSGLVGDMTTRTRYVGPLDKPPYYRGAARAGAVGINSHGLVESRRAGAARARRADPGALRGRQLGGCSTSAAATRAARRTARDHLGLRRRAHRVAEGSAVARGRVRDDAQACRSQAIWDFVHEMDNWAPFVTRLPEPREAERDRLDLGAEGRRRHARAHREVPGPHRRVERARARRASRSRA